MMSDREGAYVLPPARILVDHGGVFGELGIPKRLVPPFIMTGSTRTTNKLLRTTYKS